MRKSSGVAAGLVALALLATGVARQLLRAPSPPLHASSAKGAADEAAPVESASESAGPQSERVDAPIQGPIARRPPPSREGHTTPPGSFLDRHARRVDSSAKGVEAKPPKESATQWIADYQREVCACTTRACVRNLQSKFIATTMAYDTDRDEQAYGEGAREAIRCYFALPEGS